VMLHITDGESVAGTLRESTVPGQVSTCGDLMFEGPAPAGLDAEAWIETRARFYAESDYASLEEARQYLQACEDTLNAYPQHEEVVIWLDHRLSDALILIKVLDRFSRRELGRTKISLIWVGGSPGLGARTAEQLAALLDTRVPVGEAQYRAAQTAWKAFTSPDPTEIERFIETDTSALPFVATALRRHLEQFPAVDSGLSRTERQALSLLDQHGALAEAQLWVAVQHTEEQVFMGDNQFYKLMAELASVRNPLVEISATVAITETGRKVLEGQADHIGLNGIDRWLGGVHLTKDNAWRWDRASGRLVLRASDHREH
jgi:hypothetical protein